MARKALKDHTSFNFTPSASEPVMLSTAAILAFKRALAGEDCLGIRLQVETTITGVMQHEIFFEDACCLNNDAKFDYSGVEVIIAKECLQDLYGAVIDYVSGIEGEGFRFYNPNDKNSSRGIDV